MTEKTIRPGGERHGDLRTPHCGKGRGFAKADGLPAGRHSEEQHQGMRMLCEQNADLNDQLILHLRDISHMMRMQYEGKASQKRILMILRESGTLTQKKLTERLGIQPGSASEILAKLENAGLIFRRQNETDRRTTDILLTDAGTELAAEAAEQRRKRHEEMFSCLTEEEKRALLSLLEKLRTDWESRLMKQPDRGCHGHGEEHEHGCHGARHHGEHSRHGA